VIAHERSAAGAEEAGVNTIGVAIVGAGLRGAWNLGLLLADRFRDLRLEVVGLCEVFGPRAAEAKRFLEDRYATAGHHVEIALHDDVRTCVADPRVDLVMVTTHSHQHREPVLHALEAGKRVYLDKPLAHDLADCDAILEAERRRASPLMLGFTRRYESAWRRARALVADGILGDVHMLLLRAVIPYHVYFHGWHRERRYSGDALNDKSSHHFDAMAWFADAPPDRVSGFGGRRVFLPDPEAPARCSACDRVCPYRTGPERRPGAGQDVLKTDTALSWLGGDDVLTQRDRCVFQPGADILDHAVVNLRFDNGVTGQLFYSLFGFDSDDQETLEVVGTHGRLRLVRHTGELELVSEHGASQERIDARDEHHDSIHFGADQRLAGELRPFTEGASPVVGCREGHLASATVFAALESIEADGQARAVARRDPHPG
jgi:predicted dehydrogenase